MTINKCIARVGFAVLLGSTVSAQSGVIDFLLGRNDIDVITVTDMTPAGRLERVPTPQEPVYYVAVSLGFHEFGGIVGGEKIPPKEEVIRNIAKTLAQQGYLPATSTTPAPTLALLFAWGTLNATLDDEFSSDLPPLALPFGGESMGADFHAGFGADLPVWLRNRLQILRFLGGDKMGFFDHDFDPLTPSVTGLSLMNYGARVFYEIAEEDFYVAAVSAFDLAALKARQKKLLWTTRISCPSRGFWLHDVLPSMLAIGGTNFGRETSRPVWISASDKYKPEVRIGDLNLLEYLDSGRLPVLDRTPARRK